MLRLLIEYCVHRRAAALFATVVVAVFGLRAYLDTPIERNNRPNAANRAEETLRTSLWQSGTRRC